MQQIGYLPRTSTGFYKPKPYRDLKIEEWTYRQFRSAIAPEALHWHRDSYDRLIYVIKAGSWQIQLDNRLPVMLVSGTKLNIPRDAWHRVILGNSDLLLKFRT